VGKIPERDVGKQSSKRCQPSNHASSGIFQPQSDNAVADKWLSHRKTKVLADQIWLQDDNRILISNKKSTFLLKTLPSVILTWNNTDFPQEMRPKHTISKQKVDNY
jgi:hypothetical protein